MLPNRKGEIGFCREDLKTDTAEVCGCFSDGVYYFVTGNFPMAGDPDEEVMDCEIDEIEVRGYVYVGQGGRGVVVGNGYQGT